MMLSADEILHLASDRYGEGLYWHIRRIVVSKEDAEDALQETFIKIYTKASTFR
ncbi:MAG: RNA polymerase sigma factor, partial [Candidatus Cryptobacteroides sp.]